MGRFNWPRLRRCCGPKTPQKSHASLPTTYMYVTHAATTRSLHQHVSPMQSPTRQTISPTPKTPTKLTRQQLNYTSIYLPTVRSHTLHTYQTYSPTTQQYVHQSTNCAVTHPRCHLVNSNDSSSQRQQFALDNSLKVNGPSLPGFYVRKRHCQITTRKASTCD